MLLHNHVPTPASPRRDASFNPVTKTDSHCVPTAAPASGASVSESPPVSPKTKPCQPDSEGISDTPSIPPPSSPLPRPRTSSEPKKVAEPSGPGPSSPAGTAIIVSESPDPRTGEASTAPSPGPSPAISADLGIHAAGTESSRYEVLNVLYRPYINSVFFFYILFSAPWMAQRSIGVETCI